MASILMPYLSKSEPELSYFKIKLFLKVFTYNPPDRTLIVECPWLPLLLL